MTHRRLGRGAALALLAFLIALPASLPALGASDKLNAMSFAMHFSMKPSKTSASQGSLPASGVQFKMDVAIKGNKMVMSMPGMGKMIRDGDKVYNYDARTKSATVTTQSAMDQQMGPMGMLPGADRLTSISQMRKQMAAQLKGAKKLGTGTANGHKTTIYSVTKMLGEKVPQMKGATTKMWVANDMPFQMPVKMQITTPQGILNTDFLNIKVNPNLPDSLFKLPAGTKIVKPGQRPAPPAKPGPRSR